MLVCHRQKGINQYFVRKKKKKKKKNEKRKGGV